ncbi:serine/threonine-protein kinase [Nocardia sp. NPDC058640]|uniref:serine/threonine-protein kinase n=1 Tax=Nocardia sp. NPDC058640 TaxID=3346571 RepID=UPI003662EF62
MEPLGRNDPRRIGDYRLLGVLGAGGMGKVYLGRNSGGRTVAVKVIRPDLIDAEFRARFRREVTAAQRVGGNFTAPVLDADVDAESPWLATGYVAGISLTDAITQFGPLPEPALLALAHGLAEALVAVHAAGIVHRDLKPSNVMLAIDGPKVIDFGIARVLEDAALTTTGKFLGSPGFMCPEQVGGETLTPAADVFALGGVLTFAAAGHGPFGSAEVMQLLWRIVYEQPRLEAVPPRLRPLVASCLAKDPTSRPTPQQVLSELARIGAPERTGWLPPQVFESISTNAIRLLDLDSGPADALPPPSGAPTATSAPNWPTASGSTPPLYSHPTAGTDRASREAVTHMGHGSPTPSGEFTQQRFVPPHNHPAPRKHHTRNLLIAASATVALAVAAGAYLIGTQLNTAGGAASSTQIAFPSTAPSPTASSGTTTTPSSTTTVPTAFIGTWKGRAADGPVRFDIELTITEGAVGQELATSANTGTFAGERCARAETLTAATSTTLTFRARLTSPGSCQDEGATSTVTLQSDGTVAYSTPGVFGGTIAGSLRRV